MIFARPMLANYLPNYFRGRTMTLKEVISRGDIVVLCNSFDEMMGLSIDIASLGDEYFNNNKAARDIREDWEQRCDNIGYDEHICYRFEMNNGALTVHYCYLMWYRERGYKVVKYGDLERELTDIGEFYPAPINKLFE